MGQGDSKEKKKRRDGSGSNGNAVDGKSPQEFVSVSPPGPLVNDGDWVSSIPDEKVWLAYKHEPTDRSFAHVQVVKAVAVVGARVKTESDVFFIQSDKWVFHWHFTRDILRDPGSQDLGEFNALNYASEDRDFVCLTVTRYLDQGMYSFELAARDSYSLPKIIEVYNLLKSKLYFGEKLFYRPLSKLHESIVRDATQEQLPIIESDKLFGGIKYQPLTIGMTYGYLRLVREEHEEEDVDKARWNDILLCEGIPNDLPVISGLITSVLQTPLCHVALLCGNRGTPNIAAVGAANDPNLVALINKPVKFTVRMPEYVVEPATPQEVETYQQRAFAKLRKGTNIRLDGDVGRDGLITFNQMMALKPMETDIIKKSLGAKAINCYELASHKIGADLLHASFVIPYFYYHYAMDLIFEKEKSRHIKESDTDKMESGEPPKESAKVLMDELIADANANQTSDPRDYSKKCAQVRHLINSHIWEDPSKRNGDAGDSSSSSSESSSSPVASSDASTTGLLHLIEKEIDLWKQSGLWNRCDGIIFRSSTNAEDIEGFNAAGLYESVPVLKKELSGGDASESRSACIKAMKKVWSSVWNYRGFEERRLFGLDSKQVKMAILCQPLFSTSQRCNGVAVTAHPTRHDFPGQLINVQKAGHLVTDSCGGARPEQHVIWIYSSKQTVIETICLSSIMDGQPLLSEEEIHKIVPMFRLLDEKFGHTTPTTRSNIVQGSTKTRFCVDVEFLVMQDTGEILVLQCRPYKMVYEYDLKRNPVPVRK